MPDDTQQTEGGRRIGVLLGAFLISLLVVTVLDLANSLLVFVILVVGGTSALFLIREGDRVGVPSSSLTPTRRRGGARVRHLVRPFTGCCRRRTGS
jgi:hypothetical protein